MSTTYTSRLRQSLLLRWLAGCALGAALAAMVLPTEFYGQLIFFGGLLGLGQAVVMARRFRESVSWAGLWVLVSFTGWIFGSSFILLAPPGGSQAVLQTVTLSGSWVLLSLGQALILTLFFHADRPVPWVLCLLWFVAGSVGGLLVVTMLLFVQPLFSTSLAGMLGDVGYRVVLYAVLITIFYGVPTGMVMTRLAERAE